VAPAARRGAELRVPVPAMEAPKPSSFSDRGGYHIVGKGVVAKEANRVRVSAK
jgi:hypothetical protein